MSRQPDRLDLAIARMNGVLPTAEVPTNPAVGTGLMSTDQAFATSVRETIELVKGPVRLATSAIRTTFNFFSLSRREGQLDQRLAALISQPITSPVTAQPHQLIIEHGIPVIKAAGLSGTQNIALPDRR